MFEEYLRDTTHYLEEGRRATRDGDEEAAKRSYRVTVMVGGAAMETFVNYIASTFDSPAPRTLEPYELALLLDKRFGQQDGRFGIQDQSAYSRLEDKLRFLFNRFSIAIDLGTSSEWCQFLEFKRLRDSLVHARTDEDETSVEDYDAACVRGVRASFVLMNRLSEGIFGKPMRAKLHDLVDFAEA